MRQWFVLYTKPKQEKVAGWQLGRKGLSFFLPMLYEPWKRKGRNIEPLFPNYLFVHIRYPEEFPLALWTPGTRGFVSFGAEPNPIEDGMVEFLQEKAGETGIIEARRPLSPGDEILIASGPLEGLTGIVESPPDRSGRVRVLMNIMREQAPVSVPVNLIRGSRPPELIQSIV